MSVASGSSYISTRFDCNFKEGAEGDFQGAFSLPCVMQNIVCIPLLTSLINDKLLACQTKELYVFFLL